MAAINDDLTDIEHRSPEMYEFFGRRFNRQTVMDYFAHSPFWDNQSNNATLRMQTQFNDLQETEAALKNMTGVEFVVAYERPPVFIIRKQRRYGPAEHEVSAPLATYYVLGANIYQSPDLYTILANRMLTSLFHIDKAFRESQQLAEFHPASGYSWRTSFEGETSKPKDSASKARQLETQEFRASVDRAIQNSLLKLQQNQQRLLSDSSGVLTNPNTGAKPSGKLSESTLGVSNGQTLTGATRSMTDDSIIKRRKKSDGGATSIKKKKKSKTEV
ncbi:uncharacterized protein VTP21DRAFT_11377 [Calcarisporiella thermophila]|uniref:uncharacterized protein n=1 Tax=Calcarisporiella thermophila TaxID=911321 RepID=UPI0037431C15